MGLERMLIKIGFWYTNRWKLTSICKDETGNTWYWDERNPYLKPPIWELFDLISYDETKDRVLFCKWKLITDHKTELLLETLIESNEDYRA